MPFNNCKNNSISKQDLETLTDTLKTLTDTLKTLNDTLSKLNDTLKLLSIQEEPKEEKN